MTGVATTTGAVPHKRRSPVFVPAFGYLPA
jgi:hypothetical protein